MERVDWSGEGHVTVTTVQVILVYEDKETIECEETEQTSRAVGGGQEVQEEAWVQEVWHYC